MHFIPSNGYSHTQSSPYRALRLPNDGDQWLATTGRTITQDAARESIASLGSTPGTLSAHHKVDTGEDGLNLSPRDFADSLGQLPFIDGHKLRHIRDGIAV